MYMGDVKRKLPEKPFNFKFNPDEVLFRPKFKPIKLQFKRINIEKRLNEMYKNGDSFYVTNPEIFTNNVKNMDGLASPKFGPDLFNPDIREYTCNCGYYKTAAKEGKICPMCNTPVKDTLEHRTLPAIIDIEPYHVLSHVGYVAISKSIKKYWTHFVAYKPEVSKSGKISIDPKFDLNNMYENYEDYRDEYFDGLPKSIIFTSKIPVLNNSLRPTIKRGSTVSITDFTKTYIKILRLQNSLKADSYFADVNRNLFINRTLSGIQEEFNRTFELLGEKIKGKNGLFKHDLVMARIDYDGRTVIVPGPDLNIDETRIPYQLGMEIFAEEIINTIGKVKNISVVKAIDFYLKHFNFIDEEILNIIDYYLENNLVYVLTDRNPTIKFGSWLYLKVVGFHNNVLNKTTQISSMTNDLQKSDYDGDQTSIVANKIALDDPYSYHNLFNRTMNPVYMLISPNTGRFNTEMYFHKDMAALFYAIYEVNNMLKVIDEVDLVEESNNPYCKMYSELYRSYSYSEYDPDREKIFNNINKCYEARSLTILDYINMHSENK